METIKFKRTGRVGLSVLELETGRSYFLKILEYDQKYSKTYDKDIPYFKVLDLETGEEGMIWIDGGLRGQFHAIGGVESAVGHLYEVIHKGEKPHEFTDDNGRKMTGKVNVYDIFAIAEA